ncbi:hypothetical protein RM780_07895 [Streptomyces sp. DSM 44917]|uniref:Uncharacterized protein n=1 Tax=Streptomyces boetiae TaxID=3075541 RepID=A0ABU2L5Q3_9ACTN|nr:hypothetical protein [Streptomyces sp. DSM 44917]MDT0306884.1 hypothetical protein [Streptomyces sp. DSM 44917]
MGTDTAPEWLPTTEQGVQLLPCHRWWDAVRLPGFAGQRVVAALRREHGPVPVIEDQLADTHTWLVPIGAADGWDAIGAHVLNYGVIPVPPAQFSTGAWTAGAAIRWLVSPGGPRLADPQALRDAIVVAYREVGRA